jgi:hypothetical protein
MNKEQIDKHKKVIQWFMEYPYEGVWVKHLNVWELQHSPCFNVYDEIVINDRYSVYRQAEIDGEIIECSVHHAGGVRGSYRYCELEYVLMDYEYDVSRMESDGLSFRIRLKKEPPLDSCFRRTEKGLRDD